MSSNRFVVFFSLVILFACNTGMAQKRALLIGIADYHDPKSVGIGGDLVGPGNDVAELNKVLQQRWGFKDIRILTNAQATHQGITKALQQLAKDSQQNDHIFFYFSGHGTSSENNDSPVPYGSGGQLTYDFPFHGTRNQQKAKLLIGQRDLQPIFKAIEKKGASIFVAIDSCYSGQAVRSLNDDLLTTTPLLSRTVPIASDDDMDDDMFSFSRQPLPPYPYKQVFFISAASDKEAASDINASASNAPKTRSGKSHGAFTDALLRALWGELRGMFNSTKNSTNVQLFQAIKNYMSGKFSQTPNMLPDIEEDNRFDPLASQALFGQVNAVPTPVIASTAELTLSVKQIAAEVSQQLAQITSLTIVADHAQYRLVKIQQDYLFGLTTGKLIYRSANIGDVLRRIKREIWFNQLLNTASKNVSFPLDFRLSKGYNGDSLMLGEHVAFRLRSDQSGYLVLLDLMPDGSIVPLFPIDRKDFDLIPGLAITAIPDKDAMKIQVEPPFGTDYLLAFFFEQPHAFIQNLSKHAILKPNSTELRELIDSLNKANRYGFMQLKLTTVEKL